MFLESPQSHLFCRLNSPCCLSLTCYKLPWSISLASSGLSPEAAHPSCAAQTWLQCSRWDPTRAEGEDHLHLLNMCSACLPPEKHNLQVHLAQEGSQRLQLPSRSVSGGTQADEHLQASLGAHGYETETESSLCLISSDTD